MSLASLLSRFSGGDLPTIDHDEFTRAVNAKSCAIVDVREPHEYAAGRIPGAINLPLSRFSPDELPRGQPVVLVCLAGGRSARALQQCLRAGRADIRHYAPGTAGWRDRGGDLVARVARDGVM
jgi:rhodanese-related sulfurtransferase